MNTQEVNTHPTHVALDIVHDIKENHRGQFFSITFQKFSGDTQTVNGRVLRNKPIKRYNSNLYRVYDHNKKGYTLVPFDRVVEYKVAGEQKVVN